MLMLVSFCLLGSLVYHQASWQTNAERCGIFFAVLSVLLLSEPVPVKASAAAHTMYALRMPYTLQRPY